MMFPFIKEAVANLFSRPSTENFPAQPVTAKPGYRGRINYDPEKCINCGMCIKVCSPAAITREFEDVEGGQKITYHFDLASCTFCGTCQDFCEEKAVTLSDDYLMFAENKEDLIVSGTRIKEKVKGKLTCADGCIYCGLCARNCPENAITVDRASKSWSVDHDKCIQCGKCISKCPKKVLSFAEPAPEGVICGSDCVFCGLCAKKCPVGAITVDRASKSWSIDREKCVQCGLCIKSCPKKTLSMGPIE